MAIRSRTVRRTAALAASCLLTAFLLSSCCANVADAGGQTYRLCGGRLMDLLTTLCKSYGGIAKRNVGYYGNGIRASLGDLNGRAGSGVNGGGGGGADENRVFMGDAMQPYKPMAPPPSDIYYQQFLKRTDTICQFREQSLYCMCCRSACHRDEILSFCDSPPIPQL